MTTIKKTILGKLFPDANQQFFDFFNQASSTASSMAHLLYDAVISTTDQEQRMHFNQIAQLRQHSQQITQRVYQASEKALISPFSRNDMYELVSAVDHVSDYINISSRRINLYGPFAITSSIKELAGVLKESAVELENAIDALRSLKNASFISECCKKVRDLEHYADKIYQKSVASLLVDTIDAIQIIKHNEVLQVLETTIDKCEKTTDVIESIIVKNS